MTTGLKTPLGTYLDRIAGSDRAPAGIAAACVAVAMGIGLFEKALRHPPTGVDPAAARGDLEHLASLRKRVLKLIESAERGESALPAADADAQPPTGPAGRLPAYCAARTLVDMSIQSLQGLKPALDMGGTALLADLEAAWRLQSAGLEAAIAASEDHLKHLPETMVEGEAEALARQAASARELQARAMAELAWRRGKV
jgi:hypothetical protein